MDQETFGQTTLLRLLWQTRHDSYDDSRPQVRGEKKGATTWLYLHVICLSHCFCASIKCCAPLYHRVLKHLFPRFLRAPTDSASKPVELLLKGKRDWQRSFAISH